MTIFRKVCGLALCSLIFMTSCSDDDDVSTTIPDGGSTIVVPDFVAFNTGTTPVFPEGIEFDTDREAFLISSAASGAINMVSKEGTVSNLVPASVFGGSGTFGLQIDKTNNRLLAVASNIQDPTTANLFIFNLTDGSLIHNVNLAALTSGLTFSNDVAVDNDGNAYVTNSDKGIIFKVTMDGTASIFFNDSTYAPSDPQTETGFNGIDFHPNGYLLIVHRTTNRILKLDISNPTTLTEVSLPAGYINGGDGIYLDNNEMVVVSNGGAPFVTKFESSNDWSSAVVSGDTYATGDVFPTTVVKVGDEYMVNNSYFNYPAYGNTPVNYFIAKANFDFDKRYSGTSQELPRVNTPIVPLLYGTSYPAPFYADCTTAIASGLPNMQGDWTEQTVTVAGTEYPANTTPHSERIEQCGSRILVVSNGVLHEVFTADDTMYNGVNDVNPMGQQIHSKGRFENNTLILTPVFPTQSGITLPNVTRELIQDDGGNDVLKFFNPQLGSTRYLVKN